VHPYTPIVDAEAVGLVPALAVAYAAASRRLPPSRARVAAFATGLALILAAFVSPLEPLALHYLLTSHLLQNVVLAEWAPPLLLLGLSPALAERIARPRAVAALTHPFVALPLWLLTYFAWHVPPAYDGALRHTNSLLLLEHVCYLATGLLLWWPVVHAPPHNLHDGARALYLFAAFVLASPLGLLFALLPSALYETYKAAPRVWGLTPLGDQQIAGLTMATEQAVVFFVVCAFFFTRFLADEDAGRVAHARHRT
jgi:putative membrane protein